MDESDIDEALARLLLQEQHPDLEGWSFARLPVAGQPDVPGREGTSSAHAPGSVRAPFAVSALGGSRETVVVRFAGDGDARPSGDLLLAEPAALAPLGQPPAEGIAETAALKACWPPAVCTAAPGDRSPAPRQRVTTATRP
jgi:hypothetical protein